MRLGSIVVCNVGIVEKEVLKERWIWGKIHVSERAFLGNDECVIPGRRIGEEFPLIGL